MSETQQHPGKINVMVADDHPVVLLGIQKMLDEVPAFQLVSTVMSISTLFQQLQQTPCDILICDYSFEDDDEPDGMLLLERIRRFYPALKIILLTSHDDLVIVQRAMKIGVAGFLSKVSCDFSSLPSVIMRVHSGEKYLDSDTTKVMVDNLLSNQLSRKTLSSTELTARELEVLRLFSRGMSVTDIAQHTDRSVKTISTQKKKAMIKLGASNDVELINLFNQLY